MLYHAWRRPHRRLRLLSLLPTDSPARCARRPPCLLLRLLLRLLRRLSLTQRLRIATLPTPRRVRLPSAHEPRAGRDSYRRYLLRGRAAAEQQDARGNSAPAHHQAQAIAPAAARPLSGGHARLRGVRRLIPVSPPPPSLPLLPLPLAHPASSPTPLPLRFPRRRSASYVRWPPRTGGTSRHSSTTRKSTSPPPPRPWRRKRRPSPSWGSRRLGRM